MWTIEPEVSTDIRSYSSYHYPISEQRCYDYETDVTYRIASTRDFGIKWLANGNGRRINQAMEDI